MMQALGGAQVIPQVFRGRRDDDPRGSQPWKRELVAHAEIRWEREVRLRKYLGSMNRNSQVRTEDTGHRSANKLQRGVHEWAKDRKQ